MREELMVQGNLDEDEEDGSMLIEETPRFSDGVMDRSRESFNSCNTSLQNSTFIPRDDIEDEADEDGDVYDQVEEYDEEYDEEKQHDIAEDIKDSSIREDESNDDGDSTARSYNSEDLNHNASSDERPSSQQKTNPMMESTNSNLEGSIRPPSSISAISSGSKRNLSIVAPSNPYASMDRMSVAPSTQNTPKSTTRSLTPSMISIRKTSSTNGMTPLSANNVASKYFSYADFTADPNLNSHQAPSKLPSITKKNNYKVEYYEVDTTLTPNHYEKKRSKSPLVTPEISLASVLNKKGLPIRRTGAITGKTKPSWNSCEKMPKSGVSSIPNQTRQAEIYSKDGKDRTPSELSNYHSSQRTSPNTMTTNHKSQRTPFQEKLLKDSFNEVRADSELSKILFGDIAESELEEFGIEKPDQNTSNLSMSSSKKNSPMLRTWNGFSAKDTFVQSLMTTTKEDNGLKSLKYKLGSMVSYENTKFKPPLLETMENFITKETQIVTKEMKKEGTNFNEVEYMVAKTQVYKECFKIFIDHSRTYGPILSNMLQQFSDTIDELKYKLVYSEREKHNPKKEDNELKIHKVYRDTTKEIELIKQQNSNLEKEVLSMRDKEAGLLETIEKLGVDIRKYEKRRNDDIKKSMLLNDAIQFREAKDSENKKQITELKGVVKDKHKVEQLYVETLQELDKLNNMVPKEEFQELLNKNDELEEELKTLRVKFTQEQRVSKLLNEKVNELRLNANVLEEKILELSRSLTPRPRWDTIKNDLQVEALTLDSTTVENVHQLTSRMGKMQALIRKQQRELAENAKALEFLKSDDIVRDKAFVNYFMALGTGPSVPKYLRYRGRIRNKRFKKKDIMSVVNEVWKGRTKQREGPERYKDNFTDFFENFISMKVGNVGNIKPELIYNIVYGAEHYSWDTDCLIFTKVLKGEFSELVYFEMRNLIEQIRKMFVKLDEVESGMANGTVKKKNINRQLELFFEGKMPDDILKLKVDLHKDNKDDIIQYERLFQQDNEGYDYRFITTVKRQFIQEVQEYSIDVEEWLREKEEKEGTLTVKRVKEIFEFKHVCQDSLDQTIAFGLALDQNAEIDYSLPVNIDHFMKNIKCRKVLRRTNSKDVEQMKMEFELEKELETIDV